MLKRLLKAGILRRVSSQLTSGLQQIFTDLTTKALESKDKSSYIKLIVLIILTTIVELLMLHILQLDVSHWFNSANVEEVTDVSNDVESPHYEK